MHAISSHDISNIKLKATTYADLIEDISQNPDLERDFRSQEKWYMTYFFRSIWLVCQNRRVYRTSSGFLGLGPQVMQPGDTVVVLSDGGYPFVLRSRGSDWVLLGNSCLHHENILMGKEIMAVLSSQSPFINETFRIT